MALDRAVVWDYDGTLSDTRLKNWQVNRALITAVSRRPLAAFPALASLEAFREADRRSANWRELYGNEFGLSAEQVDEAGRLWTRYQLADQTPAPLFEGVEVALRSLSRFPQAIFSQNSRQAIRLALEAAGLDECIRLVIGYEEVGPERQKPAPDGLLYCLEHLGLTEGKAYYVGDHDTDIACARRANEVLENSGVDLTVISIGAEFGGEGRRTWASEPDAVVSRPQEVVEIVMANEGS